MPQRPMFPALFLLCCLISGGDSIVLPAGYSSVTPPSRALGLAEPTLVLAQMYATKVHSVNEKKESISIEGYFRLSWQDSRLNTSTTEVEYPNADSIWKPDFYLSNAIRNNFGSEGTQYDGEMLRISPSGAVLWSQRMRLEMDCPLSLWQMPFDTQTCMFDIGLYRSRATDVVIQWQNDSKGVPSGWDWTDKVGLPVAWRAMTLAAEHTIDVYSTGSYSSSRARLKLTRKVSSLIPFAFSPSIIFVVASYSGFFISPGAAPARVALAFLCTLMVLNNMNAIRGSLPPGLSIYREERGSWLLAFMYGCFVFNVVAFLEYAVVNFGTSAASTLQAKELKKAAKPASPWLSAAAKLKAKEGPDRGATSAPIEDQLWAGTEGANANGAAAAPAEVIVETGPDPDRWLRFFAKFKDLDHTFRWLFPLAFSIYCGVMAYVFTLGDSMDK